MNYNKSYKNINGLDNHPYNMIPTYPNAILDRGQKKPNQMYNSIEHFGVKPKISDDCGCKIKKETSQIEKFVPRPARLEKFTVSPKIPTCSGCDAKYKARLENYSPIPNSSCSTCTTQAQWR